MQVRTKDIVSQVCWAKAILEKEKPEKIPYWIIMLNLICYKYFLLCLKEIGNLFWRKNSYF
jgi:hypothetical protein